MTSNESAFVKGDELEYVDEEGTAFTRCGYRRDRGQNIVVRGKRVMLDSDLAEVYQVETRVLNQAVKRNLRRFPSDFMFQLILEESAALRNSSQFVMSSKKHRDASYRPFAFTEHGAVMLASELNSPTALEESIVVVRAFVKMRTMLALHRDLADRVEELEKVTDDHGRKFAVVSDC